MCHTIVVDSSFVEFLVRADEEMAAETRAAGCLWCGNALHLNRFPRKPRGVPAAWTGHFNYRLSFDCSVCSRRHTSPSVRFFDRRVYVAFAVVLRCAVQTGLSEFRVKAVSRWIAVPRRTIKRWRLWWSEVFAKSAFFRAERGRFKPATIEDTTLPGSLLLGFEGADLSSRLQGLLRFLAPLGERG